MNGPLYARGNVEIRGLDGQVIRSDTRVSLCRCGLARQILFCDNTCRTAHWRGPADG
ncbi:MAG: CDGSH iron-sulfur domain-containing protein [Gemmatimonadaceae bacterium]|nr:CDGSH iron-sulfur domain-containing protein [Gemmatimonadaceae bacterium]